MHDRSIRKKYKHSIKLFIKVERVGSIAFDDWLDGHMIQIKSPHSAYRIHEKDYIISPDDTILQCIVMLRIHFTNNNGKETKGSKIEWKE